MKFCGFVSVVVKPMVLYRYFGFLGERANFGGNGYIIRIFGEVNICFEEVNICFGAELINKPAIVTMGILSDIREIKKANKALCIISNFSGFLFCVGGGRGLKR
ncbi:seg [candidate division SR1 bacterium RAAC1_SR1_1]|nr:seg [candidate division SR1 bacterium RAAC1_SR1_1]